MSIGDSVLWNSSALISDSDTGNHLATGTYAVDTSNQLLGLQIGTDLIFRRCKWSWGVHSKVGPYIDFARSKQDITNSADGDPFSSITLDDHFNVTKQKVALIGEVGFEANYKFTPNMVGKVSYDFMWISGIALAPEQFQLTDTPGPRINTNGNIFAQGLTLGLEWNW
jgi:hypothetical protein